MDHRPQHNDFLALEVTREEELYGTPTVPLSLVLEKADQDAELDEELS